MRHLANNIVPPEQPYYEIRNLPKVRQQGTANYPVRNFFHFPGYLLGLPISSKSAGLLQGSNWTWMLLGRSPRASSWMLTK
ncbi:hypothetical protein V8C40DRAFT_244511 [Trichoderma camerunense]